MTTATTKPTVHTEAKDTLRFYIPLGRVRPILMGATILQQRDDLSGKFSKKLGRQRRALARADEEVVARRNDLTDAFSKREPDGSFSVVYAEKPDGTPVFKKDASGADTTERVVADGQRQITDRKAYDKAMLELLKEKIVIECPAFTAPANAADGVPELERFKSVKGEVIDVLMDLEEGADTTVPGDVDFVWVRTEVPRERALALVQEDEGPTREVAPAAPEEAAEGDRSAP